MRTRNTGNRGRPVSLGMAILGILALSIFLINSENVYASKIQAQSPATIFAASCATCHGPNGLGGVTFVKDNPGDNRIAPKVAGLDVKTIKSRVRSGTLSNSMPAFGKEEITDAELSALATWINSNNTSSGVPAPVAPTGTAVRLDILDADPWYSDGTRSDDTTNVGGTDYDSRVDLATGEYLKVYNTGRTWHTLTNGRLAPTYPNKDSGFIGYAGNFKTAPGDLGDMGYYYATQAAGQNSADQLTVGLAPGCHNYYCKMHPYMQVEVCTSSNNPGGLSRASKDYMPTLPALGAGEVWVVTQSQEEATENTTTVANNSVIGLDGTYQVIAAGTAGWPVTYIGNVGNNPHNAWPGKDGSGDDVVLSASWHDNSVSLMDADAKTLIRERRSGAGNAHVMTTPGYNERFYVTHMGGSALQEIDVDKLALGQDPNVSTGRTSGGTGPHGLWMCDPIGGYNYVLTADTFGNSATLYNTTLKRRVSVDSGGKAPLAPSIMGGFGNGCERGFTNNALTTDVSIYTINANPGQETIQHETFNNNIDVAAPGIDYNGAGNISLRDFDDSSLSYTDGNNLISVTASAGGNKTISNPVDPVRWAALPIQTPVSPADSTHPQYVVTANKASFNVSVTRLGDGKPVSLGSGSDYVEDGLPKEQYAFPSGLGAHGVTYGPKASCTKDWTGTSGLADEKCYYAYVTNTFEGGENSSGANAGYISVFDLENINTPSMGGLTGPVFGGASAFTITATLYDDATDVDAITDDGVCLDLTGGDGVLNDTNSETVYVEGAAAGIVICDLAGVADDVPLGCAAVVGGIDAGKVTAGAPSPNCPTGTIDLNLSGGAGAGPCTGLGLTTDIVEIAVCAGLTNGGDMDGDGVSPDLRAPITALCPDCRSGVHVGDIPLDDAPLLTTDPTEYTYVKEDVWVDDITPFFLQASGASTTLGLPLGAHFGGTTNGILPNADLELQISTGGQGIMGRNPATGSAPAVPWP